MPTLRRLLPLIVVAGAAMTACGGSITDVATRPPAPTAAPAVSPFCEALDRSQTAGQEVV